MAYIPGAPSDVQEKMNEREKNNSSSSSSSYDPKTSSSSNDQGFNQSWVDQHQEQINDAQEKVQEWSQDTTSWNNPVVDNTSSSSDNSSSSSSSSSHNGMPSNVEEILHKQEKDKQASISSNGHNGMPSNVEAIIRKQQQANNAYINTLLGEDASKVLANTNTAQLFNNLSSGDSVFKQVQEFNAKRVYDALPTSERNKIAELMQYNKTAVTKLNRTAKEIYKLIQTNEAEYQQRTLAQMLQNKYWDADRPQPVSFATAIDYHNMERRGFETVYIEDGNGLLDNKGGVYTIGRERLAGVPSNVNTVLVDHDGNWRYILESDKRASAVEDIRNRQYALTAVYEDKLNKEFTRNTLYSANLTYLEGQLKRLDAIANRTRKQEDIDKYQATLEEYYKYAQYSKASNNEIARISSEWAARYNNFEEASRRYSKWTVEDEERFQNIGRALSAIGHSNNIAIDSTSFSNIQDSRVAAMLAAEATKAAQENKSYNTATLIAEYNALKNRRDAEGNLPVFINMDAINRMRKTEENMKKAVDQYNLWDAATVHLEKGEDLGNYVKRLIFRDIIDPFTDAEKAANEKQMTEQVNWALTFGGFKPEYFKEDLQGIWNSTYGKAFKAVSAFGTDFKQSVQAYNAAAEDLKHANSYEAAEIQLKMMQYAQAQDNAYKQLGSTLFNNIVSNLSIFDIASVQSTFTAWRMAAHPERYANDPDFIKMQDAYKAIYGTDYRGAMDAGNMIHAMLNVKLGKTGTNSDYIYLDGSDLRYASGEKYGFWASLGVGLGTDLSAVVGLGKTALSAVVEKGGARILGKAASESFIESLIRAGVTKEAAEEFVESSAFRRALRKDIQTSLGKYIRDGGTGLEDSMRKVLKNRADDFKGLFLKDENFKMGTDTFGDVLNKTKDAQRYADFLETAEKVVADTTDVAERSFLINRGAVVANTLGSLDDLLNDVQMKLFKATNPVAGAVTAIARGSEWIKAIKNLKAADEELLSKIAVTASILQADVSKLNWDSCLDSVNFKQLQKEILDEFSWGAMGDVKHKLAYGTSYADTIKRFSDYKDGIMNGVASSYIDNVINKLQTTLKSDGLEGLEELARMHNFTSFDEMYSVIKTNLEDLIEYNKNAKGIIEAFSNVYDTTVTKQKVKDISKYVEAAKDHLHGVENAYNIGSKDFAVISVSNAVQHPEFVQGTAKTLSDNIHDFLYKANADMMLFTDSTGNLATIHEAGTAAIEALDNLALGNLASGDITEARVALEEYINEVKNVYIKNLDNWEANVMRDAFGTQHYIDEINKIFPDHAGNREVLNTVHDNLISYFEKRGIKVTEEDIDKVLKTDPRDFAKLSMTERQSVIYRITENKGSNAIAQIHDSNLKVITDALTDCNSQLNKNISLLQTQMDEAAYKRINDAFANATAIENTRIISDLMRSEGVDSTMYMAVMDVFTGNANIINRIVQNNSPDVAASKIRDFVMAEARKQIALHNGTYSTFRNLAADTVDVSTNVKNIEANLDDFIEAEDQYIDICVSMVRSTDSAAPKDIAFHMRGASDNPKVFRKDTQFSVFDDGFASRTYGKSAAQLTQEYADLGITGGLTNSEWQRQIKATIDQYKQMALEQNKTIRFIGFNSSDAISGGNKYLSDVLRSCGVNANTANTLDLADIMRAAKGEYVFDPKHIDSLYRGLRDAINNATSRSVSLGVSPTIVYDSKYTCADMLKGVFDNHDFENDFFNEQAKYIVEELETTIKGLGTGEYNKSGLAMGAYLDATAFAQIIEDAGQSAIHSNGELMKIITESTVNGETQLGLHKIIETAMDNEWVDYSKINPAWFTNFSVREKVHTSVLQINNIYSNLNRIDLITDADLDGLKYIYSELVNEMPASLSDVNIMTHIFKVEDLTAQQLYAVNKWLLDKAEYVMEPAKFDAMYSKMLFNASRPASYLSDVGYRFVRSNIVDYTDDSLDAFLVKFLDTSEEGYRYAQALNELAAIDKTSTSLKNYMDAVEGIFQENNIHGVQDRIIALQMAEVHRPIIQFQDEVKAAYEAAYSAAYRELLESAPYNTEMIEKIATERGVKAAKEEIMRTGDTIRRQSIEAVIDLDEEALKTHLIRNCCGGLVIDPTAKAMKGIDLPLLFERWKQYGLAVEEFTLTEGAVKDRKLFRVYVEELTNADMDEVFAKYNHARVHFSLKDEYGFDRMVANRFDSGEFRHASFGASDMTLTNAEHIDNFRRLFFSDSGTILDLNKNFRGWANELYSCNMWTDMDLKQLVNPYYTDNVLNNIAQNTHQLRNNISAVHDLGSIVNNRYMNTKYILESSGVYKRDIPLWEQRKEIVRQITDQNQHLCRVSIDSSNRLKVIDYTPRLKKLQGLKKDTNKFFESILDNTIMLDESMMEQLSDWTKSTTIALRYQSSNIPEWLTDAYGIYKKTIRNATITMYLYGNLGTAVRNATDSSTKGMNEVLQYNQSATSYLRYYTNAVSDSLEYANIYQKIETELGTVNHETITKFFNGDTAAMNKFNIFYGYERTLGGDTLTDLTLKETRAKNIEYLMQDTPIIAEQAERIRKIFDDVYGSPKYYGLTRAQIETHMVEIHDKCMKAIKKQLNPDREIFDIIDAKFWDYHPTVASWGDKMTEFPILKFNQNRFNNAETRARLAVYQTFLEGGASEAEAMKHVTATQFHYAGIGKVEDFMPFTQYKLYNALYWFDHANAHAVSTAWRAAQYNDDGYMTNQEIAAMITKYNQKKYYIYDQGADADYDEYFENNLNVAGHILLDGVDSYLGVPRTFNAGNLDLNGTHYLKLGNSFVEEIDMVLSCAAGAYAFATTLKDNIASGTTTAEKIRHAYDSFKFTPLYDSFYSPWKSYIDLIAFSYDHKKETRAKAILDGRAATMVIDGKAKNIDEAADIIAKSSSGIWSNYEAFMANKGTHSEAIAALPVVGAILSNMVGRWKSFDLNLGELAALVIDPDAKFEMYSYVRDLICDTAGMLIPSVVGTKVEPAAYTNIYGAKLTKEYLIENPTTYFDIIGRLQNEMGFDADQAQQIYDSMKTGWELGDYKSKLDYYHIAKDLYGRGFTQDEIINLFKQQKLPNIENKRFLAMTQSLPNFLAYDKNLRNQMLSYYKALGYDTDAAWAKLMLQPIMFHNGKVIELTAGQTKYLSNQHDKAYWALHSNYLTEDEWQAYWDTLRELGFYYPKGKWAETRDYLVRSGYTHEEARAILLHGYMLDDNGRLVDVQGQARTRIFGYKYNPETYKHPLGYADFNTYYQTIPDYCKYEKGAFKRTYAALKSLGFDYNTSLSLIQQGAYLMDASGIPNIVQTLGSVSQNQIKPGKITTVADLISRYNGQIITGADGKPYIFIDCSGLQRPRKSFSYTRGSRGRSGGSGRRSNWYTPKKRKKTRAKLIKPHLISPRYINYYTRKPFISEGNVSSFSGFTSYRGSNKLTKPYTTQGFVSTYSAQNFLNGSSYGMRKVYKIDMRQFKTGAISTKRAYPASYRNIAVAYRRNLYKDLYAKYGASRMQMRANQAGYSNASIVRLRRNEIYNRERYAERRDRKAQEKVRTRAT